MSFDYFVEKFIKYQVEKIEELDEIKKMYLNSGDYDKFNFYDKKISSEYLKLQIKFANFMNRLYNKQIDNNYYIPSEESLLNYVKKDFWNRQIFRNNKLSFYETIKKMNNKSSYVTKISIPDDYVDPPLPLNDLLSSSLDDENIIDNKFIYNNTKSFYNFNDTNEDKFMKYKNNYTIKDDDINYSINKKKQFPTKKG